MDIAEHALSLEMSHQLSALPRTTSLEVPNLAGGLERTTQLSVVSPVTAAQSASTSSNLVGGLERPTQSSVLPLSVLPLTATQSASTSSTAQPATAPLPTIPSSPEAPKKVGRPSNKASGFIESVFNEIDTHFNELAKMTGMT